MPFSSRSTTSIIYTNHPKSSVSSITNSGCYTLIGEKSSDNNCVNSNISHLKIIFL
uniref:Candidate secreted effector n=1 Tax=Meloidogyne incognita TaxID=6306 RepID=A0A914LU96_MELIC